MSRRDFPQTPPSLKEVKELEKQAEQNISSAEARLSIVTNDIAAAETRKAQVEAETTSAEDRRSTKLAELAVVEGQISEAKNELRSVEGRVFLIKEEEKTLSATVEKAKEDHAVLLEDLKKSHDDQMAVYESTQNGARATLAEIEKTIESKKRELEGVERVVSVFKREESRLETEVLPKVAEAKTDLENLNREILLKKVELQNTTDKQVEMAGMYHDEKTKYEEVNALRVGEEQRIEAELKKLIEKETEVENKARSLRTIQQGVDQATLRLERKEEELTLREHLFKQKEVTLT